jgi:hypothetical protein
MATPSCTACGAPAAPEARFCRECGADLTTDGGVLDQPGPAAVSAGGFSTREAVSFGWRTTTGNLPFLVGFTFVFIVLQIGLQLAVSRAARGSEAGPVLANLVSLAVSGVLGTGLITITLKLCDGAKPSARDLFPTSQVVVRYIFVSLLWEIIVVVGVILLIVPGVIWGLKFMFAPYFVVEKGLGPLEALRASSRITDGVKWKLLWFSLVSAGIILLGLIFLLVGILVAAPVAWIAGAFVYRRLLVRAGTEATRSRAG